MKLCYNKPMRKWGLLGLLWLCATAFAQDKTLTITIPGLTVRNAIAKIAELTDEKLQVADSANYNTLVLHLTDVPLEEALSKIAEVTAGYWAKAGDKRVLRFDREKEKQQLAETRARRLQAIQEQVDEAVADLEPWSEFKARMGSYAHSIATMSTGTYADEDKFRSIRELREQGVGTRLAVKLASLFDMNDVLDMPEQSRVMYSNRPTNMQRKLPSGADNVISQFLAEFAEWKQAVLPTLDEFPVTYGYDMRKFVSYSTQLSGHVLLEVRRDDWAQSVTFIIRAYDDQGQEIEGGFTGYRFSLPPENSKYEFNKVEMSSDDLAFTDFINSIFRSTLPSGQSGADASEEWLDRYADCATDEPLSWLPGRALVKSVQEKEDDIVALIPDLALFEFVSVNSWWKKEISGQELADWIVKRWLCNVEFEDGCVSISPREPSVARSSYLRRKPLEDMMKAVKRDRTLTVIEASKYAIAQEGNLSFRGIERWFVSSVIPIGGNYRPSQLLMFSKSALRFLGSLTSDEIQLAQSSSGLPMTMLKGKSATALNTWLFYQSDMVYGLQHAKRPLIDDDDWRIDSPVWIERRASSALPNGVPRDSSLRIRIEDEPMIFAKQPSDRIVRSEKLVSFRRIALSSGEGSALYQPADLTVFHIELSLGKDVSADFTLEQVPALRKDWVALNQLSEQLRSYITEQIEKARKAREEYEQSRAQQKPPPVS